MQSNLLRFNKKQKYIVFDTETESLALALARPWQLSWLVYEDHKIVKNEDHMIYWKDFNVSADAARITGATRLIAPPIAGPGFGNGHPQGQGTAHNVHLGIQHQRSH